MALHWPTFFTRLGSAIVFCIVMMVGLLWNEWAFLVLVALIQVLCLREYFRLMKAIYPTYYWPEWMHAVIQLSCLGALLSYSPLYEPLSNYITLLVALPGILFWAALFSIQKTRTATGFALLGIAYIGFPMLLLYNLYLWDSILPLVIILMLWMNDTMAYLVGSFIGRTPFSKISPKKTWEGTGGGVLLTLVGAGIWGYYGRTDNGPVVWIGLAAVVAIAGTFGDLLQSKLKRMANVKDSGKLMPGHGGALDRFDSLLIATPFAYAYAYLFMG